jgi:HSP20 family protein
VIVEDFGGKKPMALLRWEPFREIETLRNQFDQLFNELASTNRESEMGWMPALEIEDRDRHLMLKAQMPGVDSKDLDIRVTRDTVYIGGERKYERKQEEKGYFRSEFRYGKFQRTIPLPVEIQNDQVQADYKDGILTLTLPKVEAAQHQVVKINLGEQAIAGSQRSSIEAGSQEFKQHAGDESVAEASQTPEPAQTT